MSSVSRNSKSGSVAAPAARRCEGAAVNMKKKIQICLFVFLSAPRQIVIITVVTTTATTPHACLGQPGTLFGGVGVRTYSGLLV